MTKTRCKVECISKNEDSKTVIFEPVYDEDPESENGKFFEATPGGKIELSILNQAAFDNFESGKEYYVDLTLVE